MIRVILALRVSPSDKKIEFLGPNGGAGEKKSIGTNIVAKTLPVWQTEPFQFWKISFSEIVIMTRLPLQSRFQFRLKLCAKVQTTIYNLWFVLTWPFGLGFEVVSPKKSIFST